MLLNLHSNLCLDRQFLTKTMADCAKALIEEWQYKISQEQDRQKEIEVEVEVSANFQELATNVIAHTTFGSDHKEGKEVFLAQRMLQFLAATSFGSLNFPGSKYLSRMNDRSLFYC